MFLITLSTNPLPKIFMRLVSPSVDIYQLFTCVLYGHMSMLNDGMHNSADNNKHSTTTYVFVRMNRFKTIKRKQNCQNYL